MSGSLSGKVLLTGAAGGQGRLAAQLFAAAGAKLILTVRIKPMCAKIDRG